MVIKDIGSCCFRQAPELTYLPVPVQPSKAFLPHLYSSQPLPRYLICHQPPQLFPLMEENHTVPWWKLRQKETNVMPFALPPFTARHHTSMLSVLAPYWPSQSHLPGTLHSFTQRTSWIVDFFSCISIYLFRWMVLPQLIYCPCCVALTASPQERKRSQGKPEPR